MELNNFITLHLDLVNLKINKKKSRECLNKNCKIESCFNYKNFKEINIRKFIYCSKHKLQNMINIKDKKCIGCKIKCPIFNYEDKKIRLYCGDCKLTDMIDIKSKKCVKCNNKQPIFNYKDEKIALYCGDCKLDNMINIKDKKCIICKYKIPNFNYKDEKIRLYCGDCKLDNMIDIRSKKCIDCNNKYPNFNYKGEKTRLYCRDCKLDNMIDIGNKRCKTLLCDIIIGKKFKGYCLRCFIHTFPNSTIIRDYGTREAKVTEFIKKEFKDLDITYNTTIQGGCSDHRPDIFIDCITHSVNYRS